MPSWIKLRDDLDTDPRVFTMADALRNSAFAYVLTNKAKDLFGDVTNAVTRNVMRDVTLAALSRVWFAANRHTTDGIFRNATLDYLDTISQVPGFGAAMSAVGYAIYDETTRTVTLPRFDEYNAPDKNGERAKTASARRQQRLRDKKKAAVELLTGHDNPEPPSTINHQPSTPSVTSRVTPNVTLRHEESHVTPSLSSSCSISESESESESETTVNQVNHRQPPSTPPDADPLGTLKRRINALRPSWTKTPHWSGEEEAALYEARHNLAALDGQDWHLLSWFFKWANSAQNTGQREPVKVSARRAHLCHDLAALLDRATTAWKQSGAPRLGPPAVKQAASLTAPIAAPTPPTPNENAFLGLLAAHGGRLPTTVATKPQAA